MAEIGFRAFHRAKMSSQDTQLHSTGLSIAFFKSFLFVDLREFFFRLRVAVTKKNKKKSSENDQLTGHF